MGKLKLKNGFGSVYKLSGRRSKPYAVRITIGWTPDGKQIRKIVDYAKTYEEGIKKLFDYWQNPYEIDLKKLTFSDIWEKVEDKIKRDVEEGITSQSNLDNLIFAYNNHCKPMHNLKIMDIKYSYMQNVIDNARNKFNNEPLGTSAKGFIKTVCVKVFNYAINNYELPIMKNPAIILDCGKKTKSDKHKPFTEEEINILWNMQDNDLVKITLIWLYTGLRPNEIFIAEKEKIFLSENYFITGSKTKAGKDRVIPIHSKIKPFIEYFYKRNSDYPFNTLFSDNMNYSKVKREFSKLMTKLNLDHTPYDCRHTFTTKMKRAGANEYILKLILGHSIKDITESVYTHRELKEIINEVNKIN